MRTYQCLKYGTVRNKPGNLYICTNLLAFDYDDLEGSKTVAGSGAADSMAASAGSTAPAGGSNIVVAGCTGGSHHHRTQGDSGPEQVNSPATLLAVGSRVFVRYQDISRLKQEKAQWGDRYWVIITYLAANGEIGKLEIGGGTHTQTVELLADIERAMTLSM